MLQETLNPEEHPNRITGSKVPAILLNVWILLIGGASLGRVCACSLRSRLVNISWRVNLFYYKRHILKFKKYLKILIFFHPNFGQMPSDIFPFFPGWDQMTLTNLCPSQTVDFIELLIAGSFYGSWFNTRSTKLHKKSSIRETKHLSTDADSSTNTTVG